MQIDYEIKSIIERWSNLDEKFRDYWNNVDEEDQEDILEELKDTMYECRSENL